MKKKAKGFIFLFLILVSSLSLVSAATNVYVDPSHNDVNENYNFSVRVNATSDNLFAIEFEIEFDKGKIEALEVKEGDFISESGKINSTFCYLSKNFPDLVNNASCYIINNTEGKVIFRNAKLGNKSVSGTGSLAEIKFKAKSSGISNLSVKNILAVKLLPNLTLQEISDLTKNNGDVYINPLKTLNISLTKGWNLFSLPLEPENKSIAKVLSPITGSYDVVWTTLGGDLWQSSKQPFNPIKNIEADRSYLVYMNKNNNLTIRGYEPAKTKINVSTGWNLIGYPSLNTRVLTSVLSGINYEIVWATLGGDLWQSSKQPFSPLTQMSVGKGYMSYINALGNYTIINR